MLNITKHMIIRDNIGQDTGLIRVKGLGIPGLRWNVVWYDEVRKEIGLVERTRRTNPRTCTIPFKLIDIADIPKAYEEAPTETAQQMVRDMTNPYRYETSNKHLLRHQEGKHKDGSYRAPSSWGDALQCRADQIRYRDQILEQLRRQLGPKGEKSGLTLHELIERNEARSKEFDTYVPKRRSRWIRADGTTASKDRQNSTQIFDKIPEGW